MPVFIDTGSIGLILRPQDVDLASLGPMTGNGTVAYGDPATYVVTYDTYTTTVNFGNGIVTAPTTIGVVTSVTDHGVAKPLSSVESILGVGANSGGIANPVKAAAGHPESGCAAQRTLG